MASEFLSLNIVGRVFSNIVLFMIFYHHEQHALTEPLLYRKFPGLGVLLQYYSPSTIGVSSKHP